MARRFKPGKQGANAPKLILYSRVYLADGSLVSWDFEQLPAGYVLVERR